MHLNRILKLLGLLLLLLPLLASVAWGDRPTRGVWVASVGSETLFSQAAIDQLIDEAAEAGVNTLYPVVWNRGVTLYPSEVMQQTLAIDADPRLRDFDPLAYLIQQAHAHQMQVMAWFEFGFSCAYGEPDGGPIIAAKPHWAAQDVAGQLVSKNNFQWMNSFHPEVQAFLLSLIVEVLENYDVDGVQGDDRLPACPSTAGYDPWTRAAYASEHDGAAPPDDPFDPAWIDWRAQRLNDFARRLHETVKRVKPDAIVSA
ncbi:MAG: family 10 glycosylhydrolase, partial [Planctomycetota bacterium]